MPPEAVLRTRPFDALIARVPQAWRMALLRVALAWLGLIGWFGGDWADMARQWWHSSTYNHIVLVPRLTWSIYGPVNGYQGGPTCYGYGIVEAANGVPFNGEALQRDAAEMSRVARVDELVAALEASLKDLRAKEQTAGYEAIWKLH